jgi:hypothetical protein
VFQILCYACIVCKLSQCFICTVSSGLRTGRSHKSVFVLGPELSAHPPSSAEVKERVLLYFYFPSVPSWSVTGRTLPFTFAQKCLKPDGVICGRTEETRCFQSTLTLLFYLLLFSVLQGKIILALRSPCCLYTSFLLFLNELTHFHEPSYECFAIGVHKNYVSLVSYI